EITSSVDLTNQVICGVTTDFSGFGIASKPDFQGLVNTISAMNIKQGILNSLDAKYSDAQAAEDEAATGDYSDVVGSLNAALNEIAAQSGKALTSDQAN